MSLTEIYPGWSERWWHTLGSDAHCQVYCDPDQEDLDAESLVELAIQQAELLEQSWSRFRPSSELVQLNENPADQIQLSRPLAGALHRAVIAWEQTDGWFDPTVIDSLEAAGYANSFPSSLVGADNTPRGDLSHCSPSPGLSEVTVDLETSTVTRPPGLRFDLGGIGKGLAADMLVVHLLEGGASSVCIGLGGDIRVGGEVPVGGWKIPVESSLTDFGSDQDEQWFEAELLDGAIVSSSTQFRNWNTLSGERAHHLIDPRTGRPSTSSISTVVVCAAEAWWAEVLAKAALLAGAVQGKDLLQKHGVRSWMINDSGALEDATLSQAPNS
ncbi:unannotated protein [freshwater metagenome]|uniref:FAD:protein FMN transferase n=2 Tax=freshwater metagenome TaxID=449393 RepID=A0A6J6YZU4_9ZZZZ|nr:hypothetical protein [Actinomycetota bacterium]MSX75285.1 hypothetical protein [Actinomycetota bacterium]